MKMTKPRAPRIVVDADRSELWVIGPGQIPGAGPKRLIGIDVKDPSRAKGARKLFHLSPEGGNAV